MRELELHTSELSLAQSSSAKKDARKAAAKDLDHDLKHLAMTFQMLFYPFLQLDDFDNLSKPLFNHDDPVRYSDANADLGLASELFFWIPASLHTQLVEGQVFSHKVIMFLYLCLNLLALI